MTTPGAIYAGASGPYLAKLAEGDTFKAPRQFSAAVEPGDAGPGEYVLLINSPGTFTVTQSDRIIVPKGQALRVARTFPGPDPGCRPLIVLDVV